MIVNMHCRPISHSDYFLNSSFLFPHINSTENFKSNISSNFHDRCPKKFQRRRRRLEDPILTYASNYYITNPHQISHSSSSTPLFNQQINKKNIYCDLYNLLERPSSIQSKKKYFFNYSKRINTQQTINYQNDRKKMKNHQHKSSIENDQQHSSLNRTLFQRILQNYFCIPIMNFYQKYLNK